MLKLRNTYPNTEPLIVTSSCNAKYVTSSGENIWLVVYHYAGDTIADYIHGLT